MSLSFLIRRASSLRSVLRSNNAVATSPALLRIVLTNNLSPASRSTAIRAAHSSPLEVRERTDQSLLKSVDSEIKRFIPLSPKSGSGHIPPEFPFLIHDKRAEEGTILFSRQDPDETVKVEVDVSTLERLFGSGIQGENDDSDIQIYSAVSKGNAPSFPMLVSVYKAANGSSMEFRVRVSEEEVSIDSLTIKDSNSQGCANCDYEGPNFLDLEEELQSSLVKYLEIRGVKPVLADFLNKYLMSKDSKKELQWLKKLRQFVDVKK